MPACPLACLALMRLLLQKQIGGSRSYEGGLMISIIATAGHSKLEHIQHDDTGNIVGSRQGTAIRPSVSGSCYLRLLRYLGDLQLCGISLLSTHRQASHATQSCVGSRRL